MKGLLLLSVPVAVCQLLLRSDWRHFLVSSTSSSIIPHANFAWCIEYCIVASWPESNSSSIPHANFASRHANL